MNLIGLAGVASAGKSTVAKMLVEDHGFVEISLADPMKRAVAEWFGWDLETLWGPSSKRNEPHARLGGLTARKALQTLGTEFGRACYPNVWVDIAIETAREVLSVAAPHYSPSGGLTWGMTNYAKGVCIADCRFPNEVEAIRAAGGKVWRILRPTSGLVGAAGQHSSEHSLDDWGDDQFDLVVNNEGGSLEDLRGLVKAAMGIGSFIEQVN